MKNEELQKHTLNLRKGDFERIAQIFAQKQVPASEVIRKIVSKFVDEINSKVNKNG